jgi:hypothetical protein
MLLHLALLLIPLVQHMGEPPSSAGRPVQGPLTVSLANPVPRTPPPAAEPTPHPAVKPHPVPHRPSVIAMRRPTSPSTPAFTVPPPAIEPEPVTPPAEPDMTAMLEAKRAARRNAETQAAQENAEAAAASQGPSVNDKIMGNINRNLNWASKTNGTGGMFDITFRGVRTATFRFNGWHPGAGDNFQETVEVDAGENGNVDMAIVKAVIKVIRKYKSGDFDFESRRRGRPVRMSARPADNAVLEAFLMQELFDDNNTPARSR